MMEIIIDQEPPFYKISFIPTHGKPSHHWMTPENIRRAIIELKEREFIDCVMPIPTKVI